MTRMVNNYLATWACLTYDYFFLQLVPSLSQLFPPRLQYRRPHCTIVHVLGPQDTGVERLHRRQVKQRTLSQHFNR